MNDLAPDLLHETDTYDADMRDVGPWGQAAALSFRFLLAASALIALGWLASNIRQVPPDSQAIIVRLGTVAEIHGPGLLLAWPRPIDRVVLVPASARQTQIAIERFTDGQQANSDTTVNGYPISDEPRLNSGFLLTGDSSVVHLEAQIFYQISDPVAYMIAARHVRPALQRLFMASAVNVLAARDLDGVLVARPEIASQNAEAMRRERLRADLVNGVNRRLAELVERGASLGVTVSRVDLVPTIPGGAKNAFDNVLVVSQGANQVVAQARTSAQTAMQTAQSVKDSITTDATAKSEEAVSDATVATASIAALGKSSQDMSHAMQISRLYYDRIGPILAKAGKIETIGKDNTSRLLLPGAPRGEPRP